MQCKTCGSEWKTNARASLIIKCPFCGAELDNQEEDRLTFDNAKEALRYIIKNYGLEIMMDGLQLRSLLDEYIPDLKQERKVFLDAYEQGVCNALYMAHDEPEIDKCIAILQSIKVLTQDACMAEKWACYVVETLVYALNWNVPMFGITPNIHMYQIPENIRENGDQTNKVFIESSGDVLDGSDEEGSHNLPPEKSQLPETSSATPRPAVFDFFSGSPPVESAPAEEEKTEPQVIAKTEPKVEEKTVAQTVQAGVTAAEIQAKIAFFGVENSALLQNVQKMAGEQNTTFLKAGLSSRTKGDLMKLQSGKPDLMLIAVTSRYESMSLSNFELFVADLCESLRSRGGNYAFVLEPIAGKSARFCNGNNTVRDVCRQRSVNVIDCEDGEIKADDIKKLLVP